MRACTTGEGSISLEIGIRAEIPNTSEHYESDAANDELKIAVQQMANSMKDGNWLVSKVEFIDIGAIEFGITNPSWED